MFTFTPLLGAHSPSPASSSLLELDGGVKILVDVGWDTSFSTAKLAEIEKHVSTLSVILLTHPTLDHLGAYAHCCKHVPLFSKIPVYATIPVMNLGRSLVEDLYTSSKAAASVVPAAALGSTEGAGGEGLNFLLQAPTPEEVAVYFGLINPLKYSQPHQPIPSPFSPPLGGLTVTAYSAGHTLGGTIWHIQHGLESIVYAADWNQTKENLMPEAAWLSAGGSEVIEPLQRPTALICSSRGVEKTNPLPRKQRDEALISLIRDTISQGGKVLIPADSSARVVELAYILNQVWRDNVNGPHAATYQNARVYLASKTANTTMRYVQSMLEWMNEGVLREAEALIADRDRKNAEKDKKERANRGRGKDGRGNEGKEEEESVSPLEWDHIKLIERQSQLEKALRRRNPSIILASDSSLEWGFSRHILETLAADAKNLVILPGKVSSDSHSSNGLGKQLWDQWQNGAAQAASHSGVKVVHLNDTTLDLHRAETKPLEGDETQLYNQYLARQQQLHSTQLGDNAAAGETTSADLIDDAASESSESSDEDEEQQGKALNLSNQITQAQKRKGGLTNEDLGINVLIKGKGVYDYDVRNKRGREKIFPFAAPKHRADEFGDVIKAEDYLRAEERDEVDGVDLRENGAHDAPAVGQKRKWEDSAPDRRNSRGQNKRSRTDRPTKAAHEPDDIDAAIARATGEALGDDSLDDEPSGTDSDDESDYEPEGSSGPRKIVYTPHSLTLNLRLAHVDFSGMYEKRDFQMLIPLIRPRKLILISGDASETTSLAEECRNLLLTGETKAEVFAPHVGELVDVSVDTNAWSLRLSSALVKKLVWQNVKGLGVVALTGVLATAVPPAEEVGAEPETKKLKPDPSAPDHSSKPEPDALLPVLDLLPALQNSSTSSTSTNPIHVGDLRIADLRALLRSLGHVADFRGEGTLLVDGSVVVRKGAEGRIEVESGAGGLARGVKRGGGGESAFWAVRRAVGRGLAVVGGVNN